MTETETNALFRDVDELLDIFSEFSPISQNGTIIVEAIKPCITQMIDFIVKEASEAASLKDWLDD